MVLGAVALRRKLRELGLDRRDGCRNGGANPGLVGGGPHGSLPCAGVSDMMEMPIHVI